MRAEATFLGGDLFHAILPVVPAGSELMISVGATDRAGNALHTPLMAVASISPAVTPGTPPAPTTEPSVAPS